jgi:hypothetical protein
MYFLPVALMIRTYGSNKFWGYIENGAFGTSTTVSVSNYVTKVVNGVSVTSLVNTDVTVMSPTLTRNSWPNVTIEKAIYANLIPATLGNLAGAICFVGMIYWYLYLRDADHVSRVEFTLAGKIPVWASPPTGRRKSKKVPSGASFSSEPTPTPAVALPEAQYVPPAAVPTHALLDINSTTPFSSPNDTNPQSPLIHV